MEMKIKKNDLLKELQQVQSIVERKTTMPILSNILLEGKRKQLISTATDLEVGITSRSPADILREGRVTVRARGLYDIVKELPDEMVHVNVEANCWLTIRCGRAEFRVVGLAADEFPSLPKKNEGTAVILDCDLFLQMIEKTAFAMSSDEARYHLNGVLVERALEGKSASLRMAATDGHRLSIVDRPIAGPWKIDRGIIIPRKGVTELKRLLEGKEGTFEFWTDGKHVIASKDQTELMVRLIDGQFPPYQQVIPKESKRVVAIDRNSIQSALKRVLAMAHERTRGIRFSISPKNLELSSSNPDVGQAREELTAVYHGDSFEIGFNGRYFLEALSILQDEQVVLQLGDDTAPCVMKSEYDPGFTHVIMPMRL